MFVISIMLKYWILINLINCPVWASALQSSMTQLWEKKTEIVQCKRERGALKGKEGSIKKLKTPSLPPKLPRSGIKFHFYCCKQCFKPILYQFSNNTSRIIFFTITFYMRNRAVQRVRRVIAWLSDTKPPFPSGIFFFSLLLNCCSIFCVPGTVHFYQQMGAAQSVCGLKYLFLSFYPCFSFLHQNDM